MLRWVSLRKAWHVVKGNSFRASKDDLQHLFGYLLLADENRIPVNALVRASILTDMELQGVLQGMRSVKTSVTFDAFLKRFQSVLVEKYGNPDPSTPEWICGARDRFS